MLISTDKTNYFLLDLGIGAFSFELISTDKTNYFLLGSNLGIEAFSFEEMGSGNLQQKHGRFPRINWSSKVIWHTKHGIRRTGTFDKCSERILEQVTSREGLLELLL